MKSNYFGDIDINDIEDAYECEYIYKEKTIYPLVTFEKAVFSDRKINSDAVSAADELMDNIEHFIQLSSDAVLTSFNNKDTVYDYLEHHLTEIPSDELIHLGINPKLDKNENLKQLFQHMHFNNVIIDPINEEYTLTLDWNLPKQLTQYVVAVQINAEGKISEIEMES